MMLKQLVFFMLFCNIFATNNNSKHAVMKSVTSLTIEDFFLTEQFTTFTNSLFECVAECLQQVDTCLAVIYGNTSLCTVITVTQNCSQNQANSFYSTGHIYVSKAFEKILDNVRQPKILFQRNKYGFGDFPGTWNDYKVGFGNNNSGSYWKGLESIHQLTWGNSKKLRMVMQKYVDGSTTVDPKVYVAEFASFQVDSEVNKYRLLIEGFDSCVSNAGDSITNPAYSLEDNNLNNANFSTVDQDNDMNEVSCATSRGNKGSWYKSCSKFHPNGKTYSSPIPGGQKAFYHTLHGYRSLHSFEMYII